MESINELMNSIYPNIENLESTSFEYLCERAVITARNPSVDEINDFILQKFQTDSKIFLSIDSTINEDDSVNFPLEFLQSINLLGVPPHEILLTNLDPPKLCNGTRLQVIDYKHNIIEVKILTGPSVSQNAMITRIPIIPSDLPFQFKRIQFPVKNCFALTINKAQGQTFKSVGVDLRGNCFSHGQLYVDFSCVGRKDAHPFFYKITKLRTLFIKTY